MKFLFIFLTFNTLTFGSEVPRTFKVGNSDTPTVYSFANKYFKHLSNYNKTKVGDNITNFSKYILKFNNISNASTIPNNKILFTGVIDFNIKELFKNVKTNNNIDKLNENFKFELSVNDLKEFMILDLTKNHKKSHKHARLIVDSLYEANVFFLGTNNIKEKMILSYIQLNIESNFNNNAIRKDNIEHSIGLGQIRLKTIKNDVIPFLNMIPKHDNVIINVMKWNLENMNDKQLVSYFKNIQINIYSQVLIHHIKSKYKNVYLTHVKAHKKLLQYSKKYNLNFSQNFLLNKKNAKLINVITAYNGSNVIKNKKYSKKVLVSLNDFLLKLEKNNYYLSYL